MANGGRIVQLDFIRSIAVILVVLFHYNVYASKIPFYNTFILNGGVIGVIIFFILSGYLMTSFYTQPSSGQLKQVKTINFYKARFFRIIPLFFVTTTCLFLLRDYIEVYRQNGIKLNFIDFLGGLVFMNNKLFGINPVIWTLKVEVIFYIIFPLIGNTVQYLYASSKPFLLLLLPLFIILFSVLSTYLHWDILFFDNLSGLAIGVLIRLIGLRFNKDSINPRIKTAYFIVVNLIVIAGMYVFLKTHTIDKDFYFKAIIALLMGICFFMFLYIDKTSFILKITNWRFFYYTALISYSIYLLHFNIYYNLIKPAMKTIQFSNSKIYGLLCPLTSVLVTIVISAITYYLIETQSLRLKNIKWFNS
jgi:peptidoglycan/LPS O-acetylase OafA/YrhL